MIDFDKVTVDYLPAEHLGCAREIAEEVFLTIPARYEIQISCIIKHLDAIAMRVRKPSSPQCSTVTTLTSSDTTDVQTATT